MPSELRRLALYRAHDQAVVLTASEFNDRTYHRISQAVEVEFPLGSTEDRITALDRELASLEESTRVKREAIERERAQLSVQLPRPSRRFEYTLEEPLDPRRDEEPICENE